MSFCCCISPSHVRSQVKPALNFHLHRFTNKNSTISIILDMMVHMMEAKWLAAHHGETV